MVVNPKEITGPYLGSLLLKKANFKIFIRREEKYFRPRYEQKKYKLGDVVGLIYFDSTIDAMIGSIGSITALSYDMVGDVANIYIKQSRSLDFVAKSFKPKDIVCVFERIKDEARLD